jgi:hypothetical protein
VALLEAVPVNRISDQAREIQFGRTLLTVFAAVFFAVGWVAAKTWLAVTFSAVAVKAGWLAAREPAPALRQ